MDVIFNFCLRSDDNLFFMVFCWLEILLYIFVVIVFFYVLEFIFLLISNVMKLVVVIVIILVKGLMMEIIIINIDVSIIVEVKFIVFRIKFN